MSDEITSYHRTQRELVIEETTALLVERLHLDVDRLLLVTEGVVEADPVRTNGLDQDSEENARRSVAERSDIRLALGIALSVPTPVPCQHGTKHRPL